MADDTKDGKPSQPMMTNHQPRGFGAVSPPGAGACGAATGRKRGRPRREQTKEHPEVTAFLDRVDAWEEQKESMITRRPFDELMEAAKSRELIGLANEDESKGALTKRLLSWLMVRREKLLIERAPDEKKRDGIREYLKGAMRKPGRKAGSRRVARQRTPRN